MSLTSYRHLFAPGADPSAPPLLLLHGTGGDEHDLVPLGRELSPGSAVLAPRGDVSEHGALRFFRRFAEGVFDLDDVRRRTHALADFIASAAQHYGIDRTRLTAVGYSNGANIAATLLQLRPDSLRRAALLRAMVVLDEIVPADHPPRLAELLRAGGAGVSLQVIPAGHGFTARDVALAKAWLDVRRQASARADGAS